MVVSVLFLAATWIDRPFVGGDTPFVLDGTNAFLQCMDARVFVGCGHTGELNDWGLTSSLGDWPLLQHLPDLAMIGLGIDGHPNRTRVLTLLSVLGVLGSVVLGWLVLTRTGQAAWFWGYLVVLLSGPTLAYARSTAGEMFAMGLLVSLVAATVLRAPPVVIALAAFGASITKETAYPFVVAMGLLGLVLARRRTGEPIRNHVLWGAAGVGLALVATSLFNIVRFGSVLNTNYLDEPELHTPGIGRTIEYAAAVLVSPSGGILVFWPAATVLLVAACLLPFLRWGRGLDRRPALVLAAAVVLLTIGFARWWTPFGWSAYGPRLMLPWLAPLVLLALVAYGRALGRLARRVLTPVWGLLAVFAVVLALAVPHLGNMWRPDLTGEFFATKDPPCVAPHLGGVEAWHDCQHELMWSTLPMPVYAAQGVESFEGVFTVVVLGAGLLGCLVLLREDLAERS